MKYTKYFIVNSVILKIWMIKRLFSTNEEILKLSSSFELYRKLCYPLRVFKNCWKKWLENCYEIELQAFVSQEIIRRCAYEELCACMYMCLWGCVCAHICIYTYGDVCKCMYMEIELYACIYRYGDVWVSVYKQVYRLKKCVCVYSFTKPSLVNE